MSAPYYQDERVSLHHGDCLDVLAALPAASVDAIVTDPPYGLEFMGKGWDAPWEQADVNADAGFHGGGISATKSLPSFTGTTNPKCLVCKGTRRGRRDGTAKVAVCLCENGGVFPNTRAVEMRAFQEWCERWTAECLRVLKPGGMMLSFGGTRTWHRLACAAEDAGFEIRDSLAWLHAQGFPKNLNVTKAMESLPACSCGVGAEVGGDRLGVVDATGPAGSVRARVGAKAGTVGLARPTADAAGRIGTKVRPATPLRASDMDALGEVTVGEGLPVVLGPLAVAGAAKGQEVVGPVRHVEVNPEALWDEVVGQESVGVAAVGTLPVALDDCGGDVHPSSPLVLPLAAAPSRVATPGHAVAVGGGHAGAGAVGSLVGPAAELLAADDADVDAIASTLHGSQYTAERAVRCESCGGVRGEIPQGLGTALKPAFEPIVVARKPLAGTVAANVLAHGTGALNIDGCRVGTAGGSTQPSGMDRLNATNAAHGYRPATYQKGTPQPPALAGRWPANVILDESQAAALDEQSGTLTSGILSAHHKRAPKDAGILGAYGSAEGERGFGDSGGASRFFYTAKAPGAERPRVDGVAHPTVKPLDLMRWLARLVTPRGGLVLDPFAGSGTTGEAAIVEGFRAWLVEREADYLPLILHRIERAQVPLDFTEAS